MESKCYMRERIMLDIGKGSRRELKKVALGKNEWRNKCRRSTDLLIEKN